jgi:hypothetical protein
VKHALALIAVLALAGTAMADQLWSEDFETDGNGTRYTVSNDFHDGTGDFFTRIQGDTSGNETPNITINNGNSYIDYSGSYYYAGEDLDDGGGDSLDEKVITFSTINTAGYTDLQFSGLFAAGESSGDDGFDSTDYMKVRYSTDGGSTWTVGLDFRYDQDFDGQTDTYNEPVALDTDGDEVGDGAILTNSFASYGFSIPVADSVTIQFEAHADSADEQFAVDNFQVTGIPEPATLTLLGLGGVVALIRRRRRA